MTRARTAVASVALAAGVAAVVVIARERTESTLASLLGIGVAWAFVASGLAAWARRPENVIGRAMVLAGLLRLLGEFCAGSDQPVLFGIGHVAHAGFWVAVAYVLLAFPAGRLDGALSRWILVAGCLLLPLRLSWFLLGGADEHGKAIAAVRSSQGARALGRVEAGLEVVLVALIIVVLAQRWRRATPRFRVAIAPVLWTGAVGFALMFLTLIDDNTGHPLGRVPMVLLDLVLAGVAVGFLVGLLRARLARSAVAELVVELGRAAAPGDVRVALARALRDPSLTLAYWLPDGGRYVDLEGRPFELPENAARAVSVVERDGRRIAALVHDLALADEPELVQSVCAAAALALENERLQAELRARLEELGASRARIVEAADHERRRIERNLHDGTQQRLVSISMALGLAQAKLEKDPASAAAVFGEARQGLSAALDELRELSRGIHPAILTERGLAAAVEELTLRASLPVVLDLDGTAAGRLPEQVEAAAYYVVSEALANVSKYAGASSAQVRVQASDGTVIVEVADDGVGGADAGRGSGLRGLTDRVEVLGGRFSFSSPPGRGTIVRAEIPCA